MKKALLIILILFCNVSFAGSNVKDLWDRPSSKPTADGKSGTSIAQMAIMCKSLKDKVGVIGSIAAQYTPIFMSGVSSVMPWFNITVPGIPGATQEPLIFKICNVIISFDSHGIRSGSLAAGYLLNDMTRGSFDTDMAMLDSLNTTSESIYDWESGSFRQGALLSASTHSQLMDSADKVKRWGTKKFGNNEEGIETVQDRQKKIAEVANIAQDRAILAESSRCPSPKSSLNFEKIQTDLIVPREVSQKESERSIDFYYEKLVEMGKDMISDVDDMKHYMTSLNAIVNSYINIKAKETNFEELGSIRTGELDRNKSAKIVETKKIKKVNIFSITPYDAVVNNYKNNYVKKWESFTTQLMFSSGLDGLFNGKKGLVEKKYRSISYECSELKLSNDIPIKDKNDPSYNLKLNEKQEECRKNLKVQDSKFKNLLDKYSTELQKSVKNKYKMITEIWNIRATYLGENRVISDDPSKATTNGMSVSCSVNYSNGEMRELGIRNKELEVRMKELWLKQDVEESLSEESKDQQEKAAMEVISSEQNSEKKKNVQIITSPPKFNIKGI